MKDEAAKEETQRYSEASSDGVTGPALPKRKHYRLKFYAALASAGILAGLLVWQVVRFVSLQDQHSADVRATAEEHARELDRQATQLLRTSGTLMRWALAEPLAAGRFAEIEERIKPLVREEPIMIVAVADEKRVIRLATNHKLEGRTLEESFSGIPEADTEIAIAHRNEGLIAVIPVVEGGQDVGTAVLSYEHRHQHRAAPEEPPPSARARASE